MGIRDLEHLHLAMEFFLRRLPQAASVDRAVYYQNIAQIVLLSQTVLLATSMA